MDEQKTLQTERLRQHGYKLKLGDYHRYIGQEEKKSRKHKYVSNKKKIRDLERLINKEGMPKEIIEAKKKDLTELRKMEK